MFFIELILTFVLKDAITMYYGKQHLLVLRRTLGLSHVWVNVTFEGLRRSEKEVDACWSRVHYDIYCSVYHTTKPNKRNNSKKLSLQLF